LVAWMTSGTAKAPPRMTPARSSRRIWDPGRGEVHIVLRGVIVGNKHVTCMDFPAGCTVYEWYTYMCLANTIRCVVRFKTGTCIRVVLEVVTELCYLYLCT
jgi:hypothetical protein